MALRLVPWATQSVGNESWEFALLYSDGAIRYRNRVELKEI